MIQANELRIGNILRYGIGADAKIITIVALDILVIESKKYGAEKYAPILISDRLLTENFGFSWAGGDHYEWTKDVWVEDKAGLYRFCRPFVTALRMKHVHDLQNTFYYLSGLELKYKPTS